MDYKLVALPIAFFFALLGLTLSKKDEVTPAQKAERILSPVLPKRMGEGAAAMTMTSAKADGDVLVVQIDAPSNTGFTGDEMNRMLTAGLCTADDIDRFFRHGVKLRIDVSVAGQVSQGPVVAGCPNKG